jgi:hypothetical protein
MVLVLQPVSAQRGRMTWREWGKLGEVPAHQFSLPVAAQHLPLNEPSFSHPQGQLQPATWTNTGYQRGKVWRGRGKVGGWSAQRAELHSQHPATTWAATACTA